MELANDRNSSPEITSGDSSPSMAASADRPNAPSLAAVVAGAVPVTSLPLRVRLLQHLLVPIGPLAMMVLAGGAFAKYAEFARRSPIPVSLEDAAAITSNQLTEIARYLEQSDPTVLEQAVVMLSKDATTMSALGVSLAAIAMQLASRRKSRMAILNESLFRGS